MDKKERIEIEDALCKIENNINLLEYVHDAIIEGSGIMREEAFGNAVLEIISGLKEGVRMASEVGIPENWYKYLVRHLDGNKITADQFQQICKVLDIPLNENN